MPNTTLTAELLARQLDPATEAARNAAILALQTFTPPTYTLFTTPGTFTFTPKSSTLYYEIEGSGVGGAGSGSGTSPAAPSAGAATTVGPITAPAGLPANGPTPGGSVQSSLTTTAGWTLIDNRNSQPGSPGPSGYTYADGGTGGGAFGKQGGETSSIAGARGSGGAGAGGTGTASPGGGGGEGAPFLAVAVSQSPGSQMPAITVTIPPTPAGGVAGTSGSAGGAPGGAWVRFKEYAR